MASSKASFVEHFRSRLPEVGQRARMMFLTEQSRAVTATSLSFAELDECARQGAAWLSSIGYADRPVLLLYPEGLEFVRAFLACLYAGLPAVPAPLPIADPRALHRAGILVRDAGVGLVLTDQEHLPEIQAWAAESGLDRVLRCATLDQARDTPAQDWQLPRLTPDTAAVLQYTSGSVGQPKGVTVSHGNILHNAEEIQRRTGSGSGDVVVGWLPHFHDMGLMGLLMHPLTIGFSCVFMSPGLFVRRPRRWLEAITDYRGTMTVGPNFGYDLCLRRVGPDQLDGLDLSSLRVTLTGAEPVRPATLTDWTERFAPAGFRHQSWMPCYGMAETTLLITAAAPQAGPVIRSFDGAALSLGSATAPGRGWARALVGNGTPDGLQVRIVDPDSHRVLPPGRVGELWVRGDSVAQGYWLNPEATRECFRATTADGDGPFLRSGDLGFLLDGELYITGRRKDIVIVNGRNLDAGDLEETAQLTHPALYHGAMFSCGDHRPERPVLVQEVKTGALRAGEDLPFLASAIAGRVTEHHSIPQIGVVFVPRGAVPRTTSGKIQRSRARQQWSSGSMRVLYENDKAATLRAGRTLTE